MKNDLLVLIEDNTSSSVVNHFLIVTDNQAKGLCDLEPKDVPVQTSSLG